ncbi:uncharacterized protein LOC131857937 [Cryptomeria japonica]|uniref:uncharacterized protein LOC131857937 n=1 Tax=Cryptomeria japonica TaxID=3369 RepID=UPI0027DA6FD4|nr:uncharacterized protein LOC131857937 [Cryptomeria japonica]
MVDPLANIALRPEDITFAGISKVEVQTRSSICDNIESWQVFNDDDGILRFLHCVDEYENQEIDFSSFVQRVDDKETTFGKEVIQLNTNKIPKGLVILERVFDSQDKAKVATIASHPEDLEEVNLGIEGAPRKVYIGNNMSPKKVVTNFVEISRPISKMLKKGTKIDWEGEPSKAFQEIKQAIKNTPILKTPDYGKPMQILSFASFHTVVVVLLQKNSEGFEQPITKEQKKNYKKFSN